MKEFVKSGIGRLLSAAPASLRTRAKEANELQYWKLHIRKLKGQADNKHYEFNYTTLFDVGRDFYTGKRVVDIGCGPLGSLEWAYDARERVGIDPLANKYLRMGADKHQMRYIESGSENIPFPDDSFDIVCAFNSLDHVENVEASIDEMCRICAPGGDIFVIVEINHKPTITEPHFLTEGIIDKFKGCELKLKRICAIRDDHDVYASLFDMVPPQSAHDPALLCAHLKKQSRA